LRFLILTLVLAGMGFGAGWPGAGKAAAGEVAGEVAEEAAAGMEAGFPAPAAATGTDTIFRRFSEQREHVSNRFRLFEVPVAIRPQTNGDADIEENLGFGYVTGIYPRNTIFASFGFHLARIEWRPKDPEIESVEIKQFDVIQSLNFRIKRLFTLSFGVGIGLMDGLVLYSDGKFAHELLPYIPVQMGVLFSLGDTLVLGLRAVQTPYFGEGDVIGHGRLMLGLGFYY